MNKAPVKKTLKLASSSGIKLANATKKVDTAKPQSKEASPAPAAAPAKEEEAKEESKPVEAKEEVKPVESKRNPAHLLQSLRKNQLQLKRILLQSPHLLL